METRFIVRCLRLWAGLVAIAALAACTTPKPSPRLSTPNPHYKVGASYVIDGRRYVPREEPGYDETGIASWYGSQFQGRATANGEIFDKARLSAAHKTLPLPSLVVVENLENGRTITLRLNDRGPFVDDRIIDLSQAAARELGFEKKGLAQVRVRYAGSADLYAEAPKPGARRRVRLAQSPPQQAQQSAPPVQSQSQASAPVIEATPLADISEKDDPIAGLLAQDSAGPRLKPTAAPPAAASPAPQTSGLWVRVGAFFDRSTIEAAQATLAYMGPSRIETRADGLGDVHTLFIGPYSDEALASARLASAIEAGYRQARLSSCAC